jgi:hypothetical protein
VPEVLDRDNAKLSSSFGPLELAQLVPRDGRIQLPFDLYWQKENDDFQASIRKDGFDQRTPTDNPQSKIDNMKSFLD